MKTRITRSRRVVVVGALAVALGSVSAGTAEARLKPPGPVANAACSYQPAGYTPAAAPRPGREGWAYDGRLRILTCVNRGTSGNVWASTRIDAPYDPANGTHDRFTGGLRVRLQACGARFTTLRHTHHNWDSSYDVATRSGSRFYFSALYTRANANTSPSYRVQVTSIVAALVPRSTFGFVYAFSPNGFQLGLDTIQNFNSACMTA